MQRQSGISGSQEGVVRWLAVGATLFAVHYWVLNELLGPLAVDETYFAHVFWLMRQGREIYVDFYANHLPTYFYLLGPLLPSGGPADLGFVWALRASGLLVALAHVALLWTIARHHFLYLIPFLFLFLVFGRMTEIRPDTIGLLLFNAAWWVLLKGHLRRHMVIAGLLAALALTLSARAAVMALGMAALMIWVCLRRGDRKTLGMLSAMAVAFFVFAALLFLLDPAWVGLVVRMVYLDPLAIMPHVPVSGRLFRFDRLLLVLMIVTALAAALLRRREERAVTIIFACVTQLVLILIDPSPFQYVYGWAAIPVLVGLALLADRAPGRVHAGLASLAVALALFVSIVSLSATSGRTGSIFRLTYDAPIADGELARATTPQLMSMATSSERQQGLWNQLALYSEICRRVPGPVLTRFYANMICHHDALYDWAGLQWPPVFENDPSTASRVAFEQLFAEHPPTLVAWGKQDHVPPLNPWGRALLADYDIYDGFAIRRSP